MAGKGEHQLHAIALLVSGKIVDGSGYWRRRWLRLSGGSAAGKQQETENYKRKIETQLSRKIG
jgi:hypothetical protein